MATKPLRTTTGASLESGVPVTTIHVLCNRGDITFQRDSGGRRLFNDHDIKTLKAYAAKRARSRKAS